jgi:hypothetical protein
MKFNFFKKTSGEKKMVRLIEKLVEEVSDHIDDLNLYTNDENEVNSLNAKIEFKKAILSNILK